MEGRLEKYEEPMIHMMRIFFFAVAVIYGPFDILSVFAEVDRSLFSM